MHQACKGKQWHFGMKVHIGAGMDIGLIHSVEAIAANVHDLTPAAELLHGEEEVVYADPGYQGIEKRAEMEGKGITSVLRCAPAGDGLCPIPPMAGWRIYWRLPRLTSGPRGSSLPRHRQQFGFLKTRLRCMAKNHCKINVLAVLTNLFLAQYELQCSISSRVWCAHRVQN